MSDCPEISTLISFALNPDAAENAEIAAHVFDCPKCQKDMEIIHETMLADKWSKPQFNGVAADNKTTGIPVNDHDNGEPQGQDACAKYVFTAAKDMRDRFGVMSIPAGSKYLKDPKTGDVELLTPETKRKFVENGFAFHLCVGSAQTQILSKANADAECFLNEIDLNMTGLRGMLIPDCDLTIRQKINPFSMTFKEVRVCCDTTRKEECGNTREQWLRALRSGGVIPNDDVLNKLQQSEAESANRFRVYELVRGRIKFRVFAAFILPIGRDMDICAATTAMARSIHEFADSWNARHPDSDVRCLCYTFAAEGGWDQNCRSTASASSITVYSTPDADVRIGWRVQEPDVLTKRPVFSDFVCALYPESMSAQRKVVEEVLERRHKDGLDVDVEVFAKSNQIPLGRVLRIFEELRKKRIGWASVENKGMKYRVLVWRPNRAGECGGSFLANSLTANVYLVEFWCSLIAASIATIGIIAYFFSRAMIERNKIWCIPILVGFFVVKFCIDYFMRDAIRRIER